MNAALNATQAEALFLTALVSALKAFEHATGRVLRVVVTRLDGDEWCSFDRSAPAAHEREANVHVNAERSDRVVSRLLDDISYWFVHVGRADQEVRAAEWLLNRAVPLLRSLREIDDRERAKPAVVETTSEESKDLTKIDALVRQACDQDTPEEGRRTAAMIACKKLFDMNWAQAAQSKKGT